MCGQEILNGNLKKTLLGIDFSRDLRKLAKVEKLFCFHLTEVLLGAYSFYRQNEHRKGVDGMAGFEAELSQGHRNGQDYNISGIQQAGTATVHYTIRLNGIFDRI